MKYSSIILILSLILGGSSLKAQNLERSVVSSGGQEQVSGSVQLSFTVGESAITTSKKSTLIITQGFQQSDEEGSDTTSIFQAAAENTQLTLFPNPSHEYVNITSDDKKDYSLVVVDDLGKLVFKQDLSFKDKSELSVSVIGWATGQYHFQLIDVESNAVSSYKVLKQ